MVGNINRFYIFSDGLDVIERRKNLEKLIESTNESAHKNVIRHITSLMFFIK